MNGRWTIIGGGVNGVSWLKVPTAFLPAGSETPVVPVDDAAVKRAAEAAHEHSAARVGWHPPTDGYAVYFLKPDDLTTVLKIVEGYSTITAAAADVGRLVAVAVLRAAGAVS